MFRRYKGIAYPIEKTAKGLLYCGSDISQIKANLLAIVSTRPGERVMEPVFGVPLHRLNQQMSEELIIEEARRMVASAIKTWEKRIQVTDVQCVLVPTNKGIDINIQVLFIDPINLQETHQLTLQMPLGE
jgi:phage baseplate assembly protein W